MDSTARPHCAVCKHWKRVSEDYRAGECTCPDLQVDELPLEVKEQFGMLPACSDNEDELVPYTDQFFCCERWFEPLVADDTVVE